MAFSADRGVPPELHIEEPRLWRLPITRRWVTVVGGGSGWRPTGLGRGRIEVRGAVDVGRYLIDSYETPAYQAVSETEWGDDGTVTLKLDAAHSLGSGELLFSATGAETTHDEELDPGGTARYRQRFLSVATEARVPLATETLGGPGLGLLLGASLDGSDTPETGGLPVRSPIWDWGAKVAATYTLEGGALLHAGVSRRTRAPSLRELYSGALGRFVVNPDLGPERLLASEIGATIGGDEGELQAVVFHHDVEDGIVRTSAGDGRFQRVNRDRILSTGLEILGYYSWRSLFLEADLTLQDVRLEDPTAPAAHRQPEYQPEFTGSLELAAGLPARLVAAIRVSHVGTQYCVNPDLDRDQRLASSTWGGVELTRTWRFGRGTNRYLSIVGAVENFTDAPVSDQCGLPAPGRRFILGLELG
jgi:iron complex outermembrane receptor protein